MQAQLLSVLEVIDSWVWGAPLLVLLVGTGVYLTISLRGLQLRMLGLALYLALIKRREEGDQPGDISHFQALIECFEQTRTSRSFTHRLSTIDYRPMTSRVKNRCTWAKSDPSYVLYHDEEWGVPLHDDRKLFEFLILEGAQAGLSWLTILKKRDNYRRAFAQFDPRKVAAFGKRDVRRLLGDAGIVRNRLEVAAAITNAQAFLSTQEEHGTVDRFLWSFVGGTPMQNRWQTRRDVPAETPQSQAMSRALEQRGFRFVGPTICYAFMQAVGMVNDHVATCFRHAELTPRR